MRSNNLRQRDGLKLRRDILQRLKTQVQLYLGGEPTSIRRYASAYKKDIERGRWKTATSAEFAAALHRAEIVFGGDFHAFAQAQRVHLRNLRELSKTHSCILAVECIPSRFQKELDEYVAGTLPEDQFLKKIQWDKNWGFPWAQYRPLFELMRQKGGRCVALNRPLKKSSFDALSARDHHAVKILHKLCLRRKPEEKIYVVYGDLHIARKRLPDLLKKSLKTKAPQALTVYLNPEKIYFQLFQKNLEHKVNIIRFSKDEFCLLESPPWVKWQSYLLFLEETIDQSLFDEDRQTDYSEHVGTLMSVMASDLAHEAGFEGSVYSFSDHDFLDLFAERLTSSEFHFVKRFVQQDFSFYCPQQKMAYLARGTVNYAAHLAGLIYHGLRCGRRRLIHEFPASFNAVVWMEAVAFFLSKLINPHRKSLHLNDLKKQLAAFSPEDDGEEALKLALDQKMKDLLLVYGNGESEPEVRPRQTDPLTYYKAGRILGALFGERMHTLFKAGLLSRSKINDWLTISVEGENFNKFYVQVLRDLDRLESGGH